MGLHALVLYMNADVGILREVLFTFSVLNAITWFLLVFIMSSWYISTISIFFTSFGY